MAVESCSIVPIVQSTPTEESSRLYKDLLDFFKVEQKVELPDGTITTKSLHSVSRSTISSLWFEFTSSEWKKKFKKYIKLDKLGEPTLESILSIPSVELSYVDDTGTELLFNEQRRRKYFEDFAGNYSILTALRFSEYGPDIPELIGVLNQKNALVQGSNLIYVPTLENGNIIISLEKRTSENESNVSAFTRQFVVYFHLKNLLRRNHIQFNDEGFLDEYTIKDLPDGVDGIVSIIYDGKNITKLNRATATLTASVLLNHLGKDHKLVKRLLSVVQDPLVQKQILTKEEFQTANDPQLLAAATILGSTFIEQIENKDTFSKFLNLANRVVSMGLKAWKTITRDTYRKALIDANQIAAKIISRSVKSESFRLEKVKGQITPVMESIELFNSSPISNTKQEKSSILTAQRVVASRIASYIKEVAAIDKTLLSQMKALAEKASEFFKINKEDILQQYEISDNLIESLELLTTQAESYKEILAGLNPEEILKDSSYENQAVIAKKLRLVNSFISNIDVILLSLEPFKKYFGTSGDRYIDEIRKYSNILNNLHRDLKNVSSIVSFSLYSHFLADIYGSATINRGQRLVFKGFNLVSEETKEITVEELLDTLYKDENFFTRYLSSMANSNDLINQLAYKAVTQANDVANSEVRRYWDELLDLEVRIKEQGIDQKKFFAIDDNGKLTGYYVDPKGLDWGKWEEEYQKFKENSEKEFNSTHLNITSDLKRHILWDNFFRKRFKQWHKINSTYNEELEIYEPNKSKYLNSQYENMNDAEKAFMHEILEIKHRLDDKLSYITVHNERTAISNVTSMRAPQFRGSTNNRIDNLKYSESYRASSMHVFRDLVSEAFMETSDDIEFGSENTINTEEDVLANKSTSEFNNRVNRLTTYGINKLKEVEQMTTDVTAGLLQYAVMACNYESLNTIVDILEVGDTVLSNRKLGKTDTVEGIPEKASKEGITWAHARYRDYLNAQVYGIHTKKLKSGKIVWNKVANNCQMIGRIMFLGWNTIGGAVNAWNGIFEIFKESLAGSVLTLESYTKAHKLYLENLGQNLAELGLEHKNNEVSLFLREFDSQGDFRTQVSKYSSRRNRVWNMLPVGHNYMWPYKSGDHYMQAISFLAVASDKDKFCFVDTSKSSGETYSLWEAMEVVPINPKKPDGRKTMKMKKNMKLLDNGKIRDFTVRDRTEYINLCRETNNRMHGVYNSADKTAFHQNILGGMILAMKGYALGMIERRFSTNKYSISLRKESEGSYITAAKYMYSMLNVKHFNTGKVLFGMINPWNATNNAYLKSKGFGEYQIENMRRNIGDLLVIAFLLLARSLFSPPEEEELYGGRDKLKVWKEEHILQGMLYYLSTRVYNEQKAFSFGIKSEAASLLSITPPAFSAMWELQELMRYGLEDALQLNEYEEDEMSKFRQQARKYSPIGRNLRFIEDPWKATDSYEYIRESSR